MQCCWPHYWLCCVLCTFSFIVCYFNFTHHLFTCPRNFYLSEHSIGLLQPSLQFTKCMEVMKRKGATCSTSNQSYGMMKGHEPLFTFYFSLSKTNLQGGKVRIKRKFLFGCNKIEPNWIFLLGSLVFFKVVANNSYTHLFANPPKIGRSTYYQWIHP